MRASVHVKIPNLTKDGTDTKAKEICKEYNLSVRGLGGEHTPIGADGTVDISPSGRLFVKERDIIVKLYEGIKSLMAKEREAGGLAPIDPNMPEAVRLAKLNQTAVVENLKPEEKWDKLVSTL